MAVASISELLAQLRAKQATEFEPKNAEQWHLLRTFWARYSDFNRRLVLKVSGIAGEPRELAAYFNGEKRQIAQAVRDMLAFATEDSALNCKERKLWRELNREFVKFEPKNVDQWHLLRRFWAKYSDFNRQLILKVAGIAGEPRDLAAYSNGEKRQIAQAVRDMLAFADEDRALNGKERKLWAELNREFVK